MNGVAYRIDCQTLLPLFFEGNLELITGYTPEELISQKINWRDIIFADDFERIKTESEKIFSIEDYVADSEYRIVHKSGEVKWIRDIAKKYFDSSTNTATICGTLFDITKSKTTEDNLRESEERYKSFFEDNASITLIIDPENQQILGANTAACDFYGWSHSELTSMKVNEINTLSSDEISREMISAREKKRKHFTFKHRLANGNIRDVEVFSGPIKLKGKQVLYSVVRDVTESKQMEENLLQTQFTIECARDTIFWIGSDSKILYVNESACKTLEYTREELLSLTICDIDPHFQKENWRAHWERSRIRQSYIIETQHRTKSGRLIPVEISINFIVFDGKEYHAAFGRDISERKKHEHDLRISEEKFSQAFSISPDSVNINRMKDGVYLEINNGFTRLTGYTKEEVIGKSSTEISIWADLNDRTKLLSELTAKGEITNLEASFKLKNGAIKTGLISASIIEVDGEKCILSITRDISRRKEAEDALRESEERFHLMFQNNGAVMTIVDPDTYKIIDANTSAINFYGYPHEKLCAMTLNDINVLPADGLFSRYKDASAVKKNYFVFNQRLAGGEIKTVEAYTSVFTVRSKTYFFVIVHDITERVKAENELRQRSAALEAAANAIVITDGRGLITWTNNAFYKLTGYRPEEVIGKSPNILKSGQQTNEYYADLWKTISAGETWRGEIINKRKDNSLYTEEMTITPLKDNDGKISHFISIKQDVTERKNSEIELLKAKEKAEISEELKSAFLAQMSHEIRSPLYRILGYISLIKEIFENSDIKNTTEIVEYFSSIDLSSRRLTKTIDSVLNMSELQTQSYQPSLSKVNISDLMERLRKEHLQQAGLKTLNLYITSRTKNAIVICDEYSVTQIFANLIDNALKYTAAGEVQIIIDRNKKKQLFIVVRDTGIGISKEFLNQLFNPFTQEEIGYTRKFEGNGLGLALVKSYCDINHAEVEVESEKGKGTSFKVTFK